MLKEYFSVPSLVKLKVEGFNKADRIHAIANQEKWTYKVVKLEHSDKPIKEFHITNFPSKVREKIVKKLLEKASKEAKTNGKNLEFVQTSLKVTYGRLEITLYVKNYSPNIEEFCKKYNNRELTEVIISEDTYENVPNISKTRVYDWLKAYSALGIEGLKWKADERRLGKSKYKNILEQGLEDLLIGALLNKPHLSTKMLYNFLIEFLKSKKIKEIPSYRNCCRVINKYKKNNKQEYLLACNPDKHKSKHLLALGSYSEEAKEPNYLWELDSSPADVMLEGGRYTLIGCIDVYSRRLKFLVSKTSNSLGVTSLLRACMLSWGIPKIIKTDNGKDYTSQQIRIVLEAFQIQHRLANPFQGQEKPHIERVFKRFQHEFVEALPNFIGHNVAERKALESIKTFEKKLFGKKETLYMSKSSFQGFCNWWIKEQYMDKPHEGINKQTPNSRLIGFKGRLPKGEEIHKLNLLLEPLAGTRTIVKKGIRVENTNYFNPMLGAYVGEEVQIRVDRFDMGKIYVFDQQNNFICEAQNYELLGEDKLAFIAKSKAVQKEANKAFKRKTRQLINKAKGKIDYLEPVQIDLEEAIREVEQKKDIYNGNEEYEIIQEKEDEGEQRYKEAKELEEKQKKGEKIEEKKLEWLTNYKNTGEYWGKETIKKLKAIELEDEKYKQNSH